MTYVTPHLISSHAPLISAPHPGGRRVQQQQQPTDDNPYKITGTSIFERPDKDSQWDPGNGGRWIRPWLPGEREAEAADRMTPVLAERAQHQMNLKREYDTVQDKKALAAKEGEADLMRKEYERQTNQSSALFAPDAPQQEAPQPQKGSGSVTIKPAVDLQKQIDDAMSALDDTLIRMKSKFGIPTNGIAKSGSDGSLLDAFEASIGASPVGQQQAAIEAAVPTGPLAEFWQYDGGADGGNVGNAERYVANSYADTLGGVIDMFTMNPQEMV